MFLYQYFKEWRKNPYWSFSCCLALLLPLNDLQGDVRSVADTNILKTQLQSGAMEKPSIAVVVKDSGVMSITLTCEEDKHCDDETTESVQERNCKVVKCSNTKCHQETQTEIFTIRKTAIVELESQEGSHHNSL